ncbi:MAG: hypothetical protein DLM59_01540 [Pseudonocardiales bacterium]|nr:MAG: hypothetical protein DLM59_01540 [Pseudonocardiales bacterium]
MTWTVGTYLLYLAISTALTVWVGRTLYRNGHLFLVEVFAGEEGLATAVNHLLVVGFYLVNFGFVSLFLRLGHGVADARGAIEALSGKQGVVLLVLGAMHFMNMYVLNRFRRRGAAPRQTIPPVAPNDWLPPGASRAARPQGAAPPPYGYPPPPPAPA